MIKLAEGTDFAFGARWALMQYHPWNDRNTFLEKSDQEVTSYFRNWLREPGCPWYVVEDYSKENGVGTRGGAGPRGKQTKKKKGDLQPAANTSDRAEDADGQAEHGLADAADSQSAGEQTSETEHTSEEETVCPSTDTHVFKLLKAGNVAELNRREEQSKRAKVHNQKHNVYKNTRCTSTAQEEQSALPAGVMNVHEDSDDDEAYLGEQKEIAMELQELHVAKHWINTEGWDAAGEGYAKSKSSDAVIDLRLEWTIVKQSLAKGAGSDTGARTAPITADAVMQEWPLSSLDPTQRVFADRCLAWVDELIATYKGIEDTGVMCLPPKLQTWLCGSAGSGKSTTLKTVVQHARLRFQQENVPATIALTAYTGVAAFNIGFGARTSCSAFQIFPNAVWKSELVGEACRKLEQQWADVVLLIVDEVSFIGRAFFAKMHFRMQQAKRRLFAEAGLDPNEYVFGAISVILVGDFGQLEPIGDWSMCDTEARYNDCPANMRHLWKHAVVGKHLVQTFKEAIVLSKIHRSKDDLWWTESCLRLRDFTCTREDDYWWWRQHDLDHGHFDEVQKEHFENEALWLCARCEDVGGRNGRKLANMAETEKKLIHQIHAVHSSRSAKKLTSSVFDGLRSVINLVRGCKVVLTRNIAYLYGLANGTRGRFIGVVYGPGGVGSFPEALIIEVLDYCGDPFYADEPKWVPILPMTGVKEGTRMTRTQFPVVAGFALTVNKAQGLTIKEGVVIHLVGNKRFRPAAKHGLGFVAFTRSESFHMTAFKNIPPWHDFEKGRSSDMLRMRSEFVSGLQALHRRTLAKFSPLKTHEMEAQAHERWTAKQVETPQRPRQKPLLKPCPCCTASR